MDHNQSRFDTLTRSVNGFPSRRDVLRRLVGVGLGCGGIRLPDIAAAKNKRNRKKRDEKPKPNAFGCLDVGVACKTTGQCCSVICEGKQGKKTCQAHDESLCTPQRNFCTAGVAAICNGANPRAVCLLTTGKAAFCGDLSDETNCRECAKDAECEEEFGAGAACIDFGGGICRGQICPDTGDTACVSSGAPAVS